MLLYSTQESPRLRYICDFIGKELFGTPLEITTDMETFAGYDGPKINYSPSPAGSNAFHIGSVPLLFEKEIRPQPIECFFVDGLKAFFRTTGDFPFDMLAASFYLISRYEEYLDHTPDEYNRYGHMNSLAYREAFLDLPLVNIWLDKLKAALHQRFPQLRFRPAAFVFLPTYDIDIAYSYANKGVLRNAGGMLRSVVKGEWPMVGERVAVLLGKKKDPFDAFAWMDSLHHRYSIKPVYFFLLAHRQVGYDKNIDPLNSRYRALIRSHGGRDVCGIHPSWQTGDRPALLKQEIRTLEKIIGQRVVSSRQHYIRLSLPETYRALQREGIKKDFSMGYGSINGFRASVASSFEWYDLQREESTSLRLYPFCFMEANSFYEQRGSPASALEELRHYHKVIKQHSGLMITIWHNHFLGTDRMFVGWKEIYEEFVGEIARGSSAMASGL